MEIEILEPLVAQGLSQRSIAALLGKSQGAVRHWLDKYGLQTHEAVRLRPVDPNAPNGAEIKRWCLHHGVTTFVKRTDKYVCRHCAVERNGQQRRRRKLEMVMWAGYACRRCGYATCLDALQFHHLDKSLKTADLSRMMSLSRERRREEVEKCELLCVNCHAEAGLVKVTGSWARRRREIWHELIEAAGGCCQKCGYRSCEQALQFHHRDPALKGDCVANLIVQSRFEAARAEAALCDLLCGNCHTEVEAELRQDEDQSA